MRILIVEDNETDHLLLQRHLKKRWPDCQCGHATRRSELATALVEQWDLIVSDYHLLDIEGEELLARLQSAQPRTPCLLLSGSLEEICNIAAPANVFAKLEKGNYAAIDAALSKYVGN